MRPFSLFPPPYPPTIFLFYLFPCLSNFGEVWAQVLYGDAMGMLSQTSQLFWYILEIHVVGLVNLATLLGEHHRNIAYTLR